MAFATSSNTFSHLLILITSKCCYSFPRCLCSQSHQRRNSQVVAACRDGKFPARPDDAASHDIVAHQITTHFPCSDARRKEQERAATHITSHPATAVVSPGARVLASLSYNIIQEELHLLHYESGQSELEFEFGRHTPAVASRAAG